MQLNEQKSFFLDQPSKSAKEIRMRKILIVLGLILVAVLVYAMAAANNVPETGAGEGSGTVSGYDITNIDYALLGSNPTRLDSVSFDVGPTAGAGAAGLVTISVDAGSTWENCTGPVGTTWTCTFGAPQPLVSAIASLQVVATE